MNIRSVLAAAALAVFAVVVPPQRLAAAAGSNIYDGLWSVLIVTVKGDCDRAYRYGLRIKLGHITLREDNGAVDITGGVSSSGVVSVTITSGDKSAAGTGSMTSQSSGSGTWKVLRGGNCSGRWEAERRPE